MHINYTQKPGYIQAQKTNHMKQQLHFQSFITNVISKIQNVFIKAYFLISFLSMVKLKAVANVNHKSSRQKNLFKVGVLAFCLVIGQFSFAQTGSQTFTSN